MVWHCIEERTADPIGQIVRKLIFTEIYENEHYARGKIAIPKEIQLEVGKKVAYYEENDIRTGEFLCSSQGCVTYRCKHFYIPYVICGIVCIIGGYILVKLMKRP